MGMSAGVFTGGVFAGPVLGGPIFIGAIGAGAIFMDPMFMGPIFMDMLIASPAAILCSRSFLISAASIPGSFQDMAALAG